VLLASFIYYTYYQKNIRRYILKKAVNPIPEEPKQIDLKRFKQLMAYYLDCIREDESGGARSFLSEVNKKYLVMPIEKEWSLLEKKKINISLEGESTFFLKQLRQRGGSGALFYGYPLYVEWIVSKKGWRGGFAIPIFLQSVEYEVSGHSLNLSPLQEWPKVNSEFLRKMFKSVEERRAFLHDIGLMDIDGEPPENGLADIVLKLKDAAINVDFKEDIDPHKIITDPPVNQITSAGIYNRPLLVIGEKSKFTAGLEYEIEKLSESNEAEKISKTALKHFFTNQPTDIKTEENKHQEEPIVEVVALNDEQRDAVKSAFNKSATIVTGPPGTGKSQVVITVLANAYLRGEKVLFTSRNHKAVEVVESRLNGLSGYPLVLRTGTKGGARDLRGELINFLNQVLSVAATEEDRLFEKEARHVLGDLLKKRDNTWKELDQIRSVRNKVNQLDMLLDGPRERYSPELWREIFASKVDNLNNPEDYLKVLKDHNSNRQNLLKKIMLLFGRNSDFNKIKEYASFLKEHNNIFGDQPKELISRKNLSQWIAYLETVFDRYAVCKQVKEFREICSKLDKMLSLEGLASDYGDNEDKICDWSARLLASYGKLLPDRLSESLRRVIGEFKATVERLADDEIRGHAYARLRREQERLFDSITRVLPVWCVTNLAARGSLPFEGGIFDLLIIDEASQCDIPSAIPLLYRAKRIMIIGDPQQLRHISTIEKHREQQIQVKHNLISAADQPFSYGKNSLYDLSATRCEQSKLIMLREHFRSHKDIVTFSNKKWYRGTLKICTDYRRLNCPSQNKPGIKWSQIEGKMQRPTSGGALNKEEAQAVVSELVDLLVKRKFKGSVGVVTPFRAHANFINELASNQLDISYIERAALIIDTAHKFQGDERDVIIFSPCVGSSMPRGAQYFIASTGNLFNVAITRARSLLHVIGDRHACFNCEIPYISEFAAYVMNLDTNSDKKPSHRVEFDDPKVGPWEEPFHDALVAAGLKPIPQYPINQYRLDLAIVNDDYKLDIEIDGEYYHKEWDGSRCREDFIRDLRLQALGWHVKRFWVYQIRDQQERCAQEVLDLIKSIGNDSSNKTVAGNGKVESEIIVCKNIECQQKLKIPKSHEKLIITCPKCNKSFNYPCEPPAVKSGPAEAKPAKSKQNKIIKSVSETFSNVPENKRISISKIKDSKCPFKYFKNYIERPKKEKPFLSIELGLGQFFHSKVEKLFKTIAAQKRPIKKEDALNPDSVVNDFELSFLWDGELREPYKIIRHDFDYFKDRLLNITKNFNSGVVPKLVNHEVINTEGALEIKTDNYVIRGKYDLLTRDNHDRTILWDWKTGAAPKPEYYEDFVSQKIQLGIYAIWIRYQFGKNDVLANAVFLRNGASFLKETFKKELEGKVINNINTEYENLKNIKDYYPVPSNICQWCSWNAECPK